MDQETLPITQLLQEAGQGSRDAYDRAFAFLYPRLREIARQQARNERPGNTLTPTALLHETYEKLERLVGASQIEWKERRQFYAIAATTMRRLLVDYARYRKAARRGGGRQRVDLDEALALLSTDQAEHVLALDEALSRLEKDHADAYRVVELRFFCGLSYEEIAKALGFSYIKVRRRWAFAKAWLARELNGNTELHVLP